MSPTAIDRVRAWSLFVLFLAFIILTLDTAYEVSLFLRSRGYLWQTVKLLFAVAAAAMLYLLVVGARVTSPWVYLRTTPAFVAFAFAMIHVRSSPSERFHFLEYGVLYLLSLRALTIDVRGTWPYLLALVVTSLAGWFDEYVQGLSPVRYYDVDDIRMNVLAAALAGLVCFALFGAAPERSRFTHMRDVVDRT